MSTNIIPIITNQSIAIATGSHDIGPFDVPDDVNNIELLVSRCTTLTPTLWLNASTTMAWSIYTSYDGGTTWGFEAGTGPIAGGIRKRFDNSEVTQDFIRLSGLLPGINRKFKATCVIENGPLISIVSVNVS